MTTNNSRIASKLYAKYTNAADAWLTENVATANAEDYAICAAIHRNAAAALAIVERTAYDVKPARIEALFASRFCSACCENHASPHHVATLLGLV